MRTEVYIIIIMEESRQERIRRVAREWYARNKERLREKKLEQTHDYRRRVRAGRPPKTEKVLIFNVETGVITPPAQETGPPTRRQLTAEHKTKLAEARARARAEAGEESPKKPKIVQTTKIEAGIFLETFL